MASASKLQRNIIVTVAGLVTVQLAVAGLLGWKPSFKAGYYEAPVNEIEQASEPALDVEKLAQLEAIIAPVPVLAWSDIDPAIDLPKDLASRKSVLSFADPVEKTTTEKGVLIPDDGALDNNLETDQAALGEDNLKAEPKINKAPNKPVAKITGEPEAPSPELNDQMDRIEVAINLAGQSQKDISGQSTPIALSVAPVFFEKLPNLNNLTAQQRKKRFIATILPLVIRANQELASRRQQVLSLAEKGDLKTLKKWAQLYRIKKPADDLETLKSQLLNRVNTIPVPIALAQASIESGWGTSRFAIQGNALFGQWAWSRSQGLRPSDSEFENAVVRSFANLFDSVRAYMHNLNTHHSYENFREVRSNPDAQIEDMIDTLISYSQEREIYVDKLKSLISVNNFKLYENATLSQE